MILPNDPNDLKTDYVTKDSDVAWTKNVLESVDYVTIWTTSKATFVLIEKEKVVRLLSYNEEFVDPEVVIENISRIKASIEIVGWTFNYDKLLDATMKLGSDLEKHKLIVETYNKHFEKIGADKHIIDVDKVTKEVSDLFIRKNICKEVRDN